MNFSFQGLAAETARPVNGQRPMEENCLGSFL